MMLHMASPQRLCRDSGCERGKKRIKKKIFMEVDDLGECYPALHPSQRLCKAALKKHNYYFTRIVISGSLFHKHTVLFSLRVIMLI